MSEENDVKIKPLFYVVVLAVVLGLAYYGYTQFYQKSSSVAAGQPVVSPTANQNVPVVSTTVGTSVQATGSPAAIENPDSNAITTVKTYSFVPADKLTPVKPNSVSGYSFADNTVKIAINIWAGWTPLIYANEGFEAKKQWIAANGDKFKVQFSIIDDITIMRDAYASGEVHIGWSTVDMLPLLVDDLSKDSRTSPRVYQQVDWSNGGDGIVVRDSIKNVSQLRGKTVTLAQNSPSQYLLMNLLINEGIQPSEVKYSYTADAFSAAAAFNSVSSLSACVSWSPDIYKLSKVKGNRLLASTADLNHLIADVWFARADFARDHNPIIESLVRGFLDATEALDSQENKKVAAQMMATGYKIPASEAMDMLGDAHWTNYAENAEFFLNSNNPTNFERTYEMSKIIYSNIGKTKTNITWDKIVDFSIITKLGLEEKYKNSRNKYHVNFLPKSVSAINAESNILTKTVVIHFYTSQSDPYYRLKSGDRIPNGMKIDDLIEPNIDFIIEDIATMTAQYGSCRIVIEGHTDSSRKADLQNVPDGVRAIKQLSNDRAAAVKTALLKKFQTINPNQISTIGKGWDVPADAADPLNQAKNRRVEVKVYPLEDVN